MTLDKQEIELINYAEAAEVLGVARGTLYAMVHHKRVPHIRLGKRLVRFDRGQLEAFVWQHEVSPATESREA